VRVLQISVKILGTGEAEINLETIVPHCGTEFLATESEET